MVNKGVLKNFFNEKSNNTNIVKCLNSFYKGESIFKIVKKNPTCTILVQCREM